MESNKYKGEDWPKGFILLSFNGDGWAFQKLDWNLNNITQTLLKHDLSTLKKLFYDLLCMNVPADMFVDRGYIKVNLCHVLAYYVNKVMQNKIIKIEDKFKQCKFCSQHFYFDTWKYDVCEPCYVENFQDDIKQRRLKYAGNN